VEGHVIRYQTDTKTDLTQPEAFEKKKPSFPNTVMLVNPHCVCHYAKK